MPTPEELARVTQQIFVEYPKTKTPQGFRNNELNHEVLRKRINWIIDREMPTKSKPGVPYTNLGSTNADILPENRVMIQDLVLKRLQLLATSDIEQLSATELVQQGFVDPVRTFVKDEPHSTRKIKQERHRLIFAVSAVDQIIERLLCSTQNKTEIANWMDCPSAPGLGLSDDQQLELLYDRIILLAKGELAEADVTGWDWSVQEWELLHEAKMRSQLGSHNDIVKKILHNRYLCVSRSVYAMPSGRLLVLKVPGVQLSGTYNTSSSNSRLRVLIAYLVGAKFAIAMGDDSCEQFVEDATEKYAVLGHPLKMYERRTDQFEFCSQLFTDHGAWPVDGTKTLFKLLEQKQITPELMQQFRNDMRNSPRLEEFLSSVSRVRERVGKSLEERTCNAPEKQNQTQIPTETSEAHPGQKPGWGSQ
jgi:hypothetical protein